jgi:pimeloyl-ACP methyl ester carboxylesterase
MSRVPVESRVCVNGVEIACWDWPGEQTPILFCHANGFHGRIWDQVIRHLPGRRCIAFDARGHGRSSKPAPPYHWRSFGADVAALAEALNFDGAIGVGHSIGGHALTLGASLRPEAFSRLLLLDPAIAPAHTYGQRWDHFAFVRRRRNEWSSPEDMFERFKDRTPFDAWDRQVLQDYCVHALRRDADKCTLACPPEIEACIYESSHALESNIYAEVASIEIPVHVVRSGFMEDDPSSTRRSLTPPELAASFRRGVDTCLAEYSHFIPMEAPELTAKFVADAAALL